MSVGTLGLHLFLLLVVFYSVCKVGRGRRYVEASIDPSFTDKRKPQKQNSKASKKTIGSVKQNNRKLQTKTCLKPKKNKPKGLTKICLVLFEAFGLLFSRPSLCSFERLLFLLGHVDPAMASMEMNFT